MKTTLFLVFALPLAAQTPAAPQETTPAKTEAAKTEAPPAPSPAPATEDWISGSVDFGYRWLGTGGDFNTYRSVVNLGQGPKLFGLDLTIQPVSKRFADRIDIRANSWGGDPYNTARIDARKEGLYRFTWDYRNIAYFDFLPSFADPSKERGLFLNQRAFDTFRRTSDFELTLFPGHKISPYVAYSRSGGRGQGTTNITQQSNEYTVPNRIDNHSSLFRAGVQVEMNRWHLTLEQGVMSFEDNQQLLSGASPNFGNLTAPFFGQRLLLTSGQQSYGTTGGGVFTKALFTANPVSWANIYGQFLYSQPHSDTHFTEADSGNFINFATLSFYNGLTNLLDSRARQPQPSGSLAVELRPFRRVRIMESWSTDRLHNAGSAVLLEQLLLSGKLLSADNVASADRLVMNYNQQELNVLFDLTSKLTLRGGHRYVWGDASVPAAFILGSEGTESGVLRRNVGIAGLTFRSGQKARLSVDYEGSPGDRSYFRTSLNDYQRLRIEGRHQVLPSLLFSVHVGFLSNQNPAPGVNLDFLSRDNTLSAYWTPAGGKRIGVLAEYSRTTLRSDIGYRDPGTGAAGLSPYHERAHTGTLATDIALPGRGDVQPKLSLGGSFFKSSGTSPARYYQPFGKFLVPLGKHVQWNAEWRWYALTQPTYIYEGFRSHQFTTGFRLTK